MSFFGLNIAGSALDAFQIAENTTSDNIANANTPGASRQQTIFSQAPPISNPFYTPHFGPGTRGEGVLVSSIQRIHQDSYDTLFRGASSSQNFFSVQQDQLNATQATFSEPSGGINDTYSKFQQSIQQLAGSPADIPARANVLAQATQLTQALGNAANSLQQQEAQVLQQATTTVTAVNTILDQMAALNGQIRAATAAGDNPNTYKDQRDHLIDQLSTYLTTQTSIQSTGSTLVEVNGLALVNDTVAYHLAPPVIGTNLTGKQIGTPSLKIGFTNDPTPSNPTNAVPLTGGQLAGYQDLYNNKLVVYGNQLDSFASGLALEFNRVSQAGYDLSGVQGAALFQPIVGGLALAAGNIRVGISDPSELPAAATSTAAGNLILPLNSANNTVDTSAAIVNNASLANPPAAAFGGQWTVTANGVPQVYNYAVTATTSINSVITGFNAAQLGVTASYDVTSQRIVFARDVNNESLGFRAAQQAAGTPTDPTFTIAETGGGTLLTNLNANGINGVVQNSTNALGIGGNGEALAMQQIFSNNVGVPGIQTSAPTAGIVAGSSATVTPGSLGFINVGTVLTIDAGSANQENVTVTAINKILGTFTASYAKAHAGPTITISGAQLRTLSQAYASTITTVGLDAAGAIAGNATQTALASNIDHVRQGIDGINIDEEAQNLVKFQTAYQAAARTVNVLDSLLQTALGLIPAA